jgi:serine/threonine protein kinase
MTSIDLYLPGQSIDQYTVVKLLNASPSNHLYIVQGKSVHKQQVLKLHAGELSAEINTRFTNQANLLLEFSSYANIVDVLHIGTIQSTTQTSTQERPFIVMPLYPQTLNDLLAVHNQKLSFVTSLQLISQVVDGLQVIHKVGVAHLDIKAQNIFLDERNTALLADFDNAVVLPFSPYSARFTQNVVLAPAEQSRTTPDYASPEQLQTSLSKNVVRRTIDTKSDMYSLGVLWFRMLSGVFPIAAKQLTRNDIEQALENIAPAWAIGLILNLLDIDSAKRPSAEHCKSQILAQLSTPEINHTIAADFSETPQTMTVIQEEINAILLNRGWLNETDYKAIKVAFLAHSQQLGEFTEELDAAQQNDALRSLVEGCRATLIKNRNLYEWFAWVDSLQTLMRESGKYLSVSHYQQLLKAGRSTRTDDPLVAQRLLARHFRETRISKGAIKKYLLPVFVIISIFAYWGFDSLRYKSLDSPAPQLGNIQENEEKPLHTNSSDVLQRALSDFPLEAQIDKAVMESKNGVQETEDSSSHGVYTLYSSPRSALNSDANSVSSLYVDWIVITELPKIRIMTTEVTNALFEMCVDEGACKQAKQFSTRLKNKDTLQALSDHPKTNVSWYEVNQQFIPWLNHKTQRTFVLPSLQQWQIMGGLRQHSNNYPNNRNTAIHSKNGKHRLVSRYSGSTMPVKEINANRIGLYHFFGNAQEWLADCYTQTNLDNTVAERCDQALVAGGSWLSKQETIFNSPVTHLLKTAKTPTTGFRLVEVINE